MRATGINFPFTWEITDKVLTIRANRLFPWDSRAGETLTAYNGG